MAVEPSGQILVMDPNAGTDSKGALFRIDATSGTRDVLSDFGNAAQGPEGVVRDIPLPFIDVAVDLPGDILVTAIDTGTDKKACSSVWMRRAVRAAYSATSVIPGKVPWDRTRSA